MCVNVNTTILLYAVAVTAVTAVTALTAVTAVTAVIAVTAVTQAFQLEQLDAPPLLESPASPLGASRLKPRTGVYTGLRPGAVTTVDESYFGNAH